MVQIVEVDTVWLYTVYKKQKAPLPRKAQRVRPAYSWCTL